jgi:acyl-CoA dehydrogenase
LQEEVAPAVKVAAAQLPTDPALRWKTEIPILEELKTKARKLGLWNLFLSKAHYPKHGVPLTNLEARPFPHLIACKPHWAAVRRNGGGPWSVWAARFRICELLCSGHWEHG